MRFRRSNPGDGSPRCFPLTRFRSWAAAAVLGIAVAGPVPIVEAVSFASHPSGTLDLPIPDGSAVGLAYDLVVTGMTDPVVSVSVALEIAASGVDPMFNGDLYVTLTHSSGFSVLINRVGRRDGFLAGYGDSGFNVTLWDSAPADIHNYRVALNGSHTIPLAGGGDPAPLTGSWQPDGRLADPSAVLDSFPRTAGLDVFNGADPNGTWTLFVADLSPGGEAKLVKWTLNLTMVPEPAEITLGAASLLGLWAYARRRR